MCGDCCGPKNGLKGRLGRNRMWPHQTVTRTAVYWLSPGVPCTTAPILRCVLVLPPVNNRRWQRCGHRGVDRDLRHALCRLGSSDVWEARVWRLWNLVEMIRNFDDLVARPVMEAPTDYDCSTRYYRILFYIYYFKSRKSHESVIMLSYNILNANIKNSRTQILINFWLTKKFYCV